MLKFLMVKNSEILLQARNLSISFGGQNVLGDISLTLNKGEFVLLVGANATGKTTLLNILTGNTPPDEGSLSFYTNGYEENFEFPRKYFSNLNPFDHFSPERLVKEGVSRTWQDVRLFPNLNLHDNIAVATQKQTGEKFFSYFLNAKKVKEENDEKIKQISYKLGLVNLNLRSESSGDRISLGQSKKISILRAVQTGAKILFLDEPLSGLDEKGCEEILRLLESLVKKEELTLVVVEHQFNLMKLSDNASSIWQLENGKLLPVYGEEKENRISEIIESSSFLYKSLYNISSDSKSISLGNGAHLIRVKENKDKDKEIILEVKDLIVYRGRRLVIGKKNGEQLDGITFKLYKGDKYILAAPNGWGKTTLMDALAGLIPIEQGLIRFNGIPVNNLESWRRVRSGMLYSRLSALGFSDITVEELFKLSKLVPEFDDVSVIKKKIGNLSGGEKQKVMLELVYKTSSMLTLFDEPLASLDIKGIKKFIDYFFNNDKTLVVAIPSILGDYDETIKN
jgi:ABC-type branched-subunit amino acid transport system ATPase component